VYQPGSLLAGRYRLGSRIATGGMGEVWQATDQLLDRQVAAKLVKPEFATDATFRQRLHAEARAAAAVRNPHVVDIYDVGEAADDGDQPVPFIVMELLGGTSLADLLTAGPIAVSTTIDLLTQVGEALSTAHSGGVVHRDIKPANLVLDSTGRVTVLDFGIARAADSAALTATGMMLGTARYISPEQVSGRPATAASDVYSLGVVAFQCLAGRPPFDAGSDVATALAHRDEPPPALPADLPSGLTDLVSACLAKSPEDRPSAEHVAATAAALAPAAVGNATRVMPTPAPAATDDLAVDAAGPFATSDGDDGPAAVTERIHPVPAGPRWLEWRRLGAVAGAVVLILAILTVVSAVTGGNDSPSASTGAGHHGTSPTARPASDSSLRRHMVRIRASRYVGEPFGTAQQQLLRQGLVPTAVGAPASPTATVVGVSPVGRVPVGHTISLVLLAPSPSPKAPGPKPPHHKPVPPGHHGGHGHGPGPGHGHGPGKDG
jgi:serine/threonine-protein kinase